MRWGGVSGGWGLFGTLPQTPQGEMGQGRNSLRGTPSPSDVTAGSGTPPPNSKSKSVPSPPLPRPCLTPNNHGLAPSDPTPQTEGAGTATKRLRPLFWIPGVPNPSSIPALHTGYSKVYKSHFIQVYSEEYKLRFTPGLHLLPGAETLLYSRFALSLLQGVRNPLYSDFTHRSRPGVNLCVTPGLLPGEGRGQRSVRQGSEVTAGSCSPCSSRRPWGRGRAWWAWPAGIGAVAHS